MARLSLRTFLIVLASVTIAVIGYKSVSPKLEPMSQSYSDDPHNLRYAWSQGKCEGEGMRTFGTLPMKPEDFSVYLPYGMVIDAHVTPIDHGYFSPTDFHSPPDTYEVRAIGDGVITKIERRGGSVSDFNFAGNSLPAIRLEIEHTCDLYSYFDLLTSLSPAIEAEIGGRTERNIYTRIPIREGQLIGYVGGQTLDFAIYNNNLRLNFVNPASYAGEPWKIHTDDPFKYFEEPARSILLAKNARKAEPVAGKIDYDIRGKLVGNWFQQGTSGYKGANRDRYWDGHLAIVYDFIDPTQIRFSIGNFDGKAAQFGVSSNAPDPATVDTATGLVKYELTEFMFYDSGTGAQWMTDRPTANPAAKNTPYVKGTALVQLIDEETLKVEVFPGRRADEVSGFTEKARIYER